MRRLTLAAAIGALAVLWGPAPASAGTPDQEQAQATPGYLLGCFANCTTRGQTFMPSRSGALDQVDLYLSRDGSTDVPLTVEIRNVAAGGCPSAQSGDVLAIEQVAHGAIQIDEEGDAVYLTSIMFATPATVAAGTRYGIVLYSNEAYFIGGASGNLYTAGRECGDIHTSSPSFAWDPGDSGLDLAFRTYAPAPPPDPPSAPPATSDVDPPETTITTNPPKRLEASRARFRFTSAEAGSTFECKLKGGDLKPAVKRFGDCTSPRTYKNLDPGRYGFKVRAIDAAGNVDLTPAGDRFRVLD